MADEHALTDTELTVALTGLPAWELREGWIRRTFKTPGWPHSILLVNTIAYLAEAGWHHPDLVVGYAQVTVKLQTHSARGITAKDIELAHKIDEVVLWKPAATAENPGGLTGFPKNWVR